MIEELEKTESTWSRLPIAGRNKAMLQKWKKELKVSSSCLLFILIGTYAGCTCTILAKIR